MEYQIFNYHFINNPLYHYSKFDIFKKLPKPIGLVAFFYVLNHFLCYAMIDQAGDLGVIVIDIIETPYLIVGWAGFLCLLIVGLASFNSFQDWFNKNRSTMSGLVYTAAVLGVWHFFWQEKVIGYEAVIDAILMTALIIWRLRISTKNNRQLNIVDYPLRRPSLKDEILYG